MSWVVDDDDDDGGNRASWMMPNEDGVHSITAWSGRQGMVNFKRYVPTLQW